MRPDPVRAEIEALREKWKGQPTSSLYRELSDLLFKTGKITAAMNLMERSLKAVAAGGNGDTAESGPEEGAWWFRRGLEYADASLFEEASLSLNRAIEAGCDNFESHYCLAGVYKSLDNIEAANRHCRKSLEYNPNFAPANILLGSIAKMDGRLDDAAIAAKKALLIDPNCAPAHYDLACYYALSGETEKALMAMEMALAKGFSDFEWASHDSDLESISSSQEFHLLLRTYAEKKG